MHFSPTSRINSAFWTAAESGFSALAMPWSAVNDSGEFIVIVAAVCDSLISIHHTLAPELLGLVSHRHGEPCWLFDSLRLCVLCDALVHSANVAGRWCRSGPCKWRVDQRLQLPRKLRHACFWHSGFHHRGSFNSFTSILIAMERLGKTPRSKNSARGFKKPRTHLGARSGTDSRGDRRPWLTQSSVLTTAMPAVQDIVEEGHACVPHGEHEPSIGLDWIN